MTNFLWGFGIGFGCATSLAIGWYHGSLKSYVDAKKSDIKNSL